jgi:TolB-like protein/Tfp pilus assembly protein PilF
VPASVPAPLAGVIEKCLAKEPGERYQQAGEVQAALAAVEAGMAMAGAPERPARARRWVLTSFAAALLVFIAAGLVLVFDAGGLRSRLVGRPGTSARVVTLAVLPFENASGKPDEEYFSDAQTQQMTATLARLRPAELLVKARASVLRYRKTDKPPDQIGRELQVEYLLQGTAQKVGSQVQVWAELVKVADQTQLWGQRYEGEVADIRALQNDVARRVAEALAVTLPSTAQARLAQAKKVDPEVYDLCLKGGRHLLLTSAELDTAEQYFQRALAKDPASACGYTGMSALWALRQQFGYVPAREAGPKAKAFALKAVELEDPLSDAHGVLADAFAYVDYDFSAAEREYKRTLELDPNSAASRFGYGHILMILGRPDEALEQDRRAVDLDPLDDGVRAFYAIHLAMARRYDEALAEARAVLRKQPDNLMALGAVMVAQHVKQQHADVIAAMALQYEKTGRPAVGEALRKRFAESGYAEALRKATEVELAKHAGEGAVAWDAGTNYAMAGDRALALDWLEKAFADRDPNMPFIGCNPVFDSVRAEPRFQALLRKMGLPQ